MIDRLLRWLNAELPASERLHGAVVAGIDRDVRAKVTLVLFDASGAPSMVAKAARSREDEGALSHEYSVLRDIRALSGPAVNGRIPKPIALERIGDHLVLVESFLPGRPFTADYFRVGHTRSRAAVVADFARTARWIDLFLHGTRSAGPGVDRSALLAVVQAATDRFRRAFRWTRDEAGLFDEVREWVTLLDEVQIPLSAVHGDMWMGNLLVTGDEVTGVVDWERAAVRSMPFADIYKFPMSYGFYLDRPYGAGSSVPGHPGRDDRDGRWGAYGSWRNLAGFGYTFFGEGWFADEARRFVAGRLAALGLPSRINRVFFPLYLAGEAVRSQDPDFQEGYRALLRAFAAERSTSWIWEGYRFEAAGPARVATA